MRPVSVIFGLGTLLAASAAHATEPDADSPRSEAPAWWESHREGPHLYAELGMGALYALDMPVWIETERAEESDLRVRSGESGVLGPAGLVRWGVNVGVTPHFDVRVGLGAFLGGALLRVEDQFFAYPHAHAQVAFGPGDVYRLRLGVLVGAFLMEDDDERLEPEVAQLGAHGELAPLVLQLGEDRQLELALTQGVGVFVGARPASEEACPSAGACVDEGADASVVQLGMHTLASLTAVLW